MTTEFENIANMTPVQIFNLAYELGLEDGYKEYEVEMGISESDIDDADSTEDTEVEPSIEMTPETAPDASMVQNEDAYADDEYQEENDLDMEPREIEDKFPRKSPVGHIKHFDFWKEHGGEFKNLLESGSITPSEATAGLEKYGVSVKAIRAKANRLGFGTKRKEDRFYKMVK